MVEAPSAAAAPLSSRGQRAFARPPLLRCSLFECQFTCVNRAGVVNLGTAENSMLFEWLKDFYRNSFKIDYEDFTCMLQRRGRIEKWKYELSS